MKRPLGFHPAAWAIPVLAYLAQMWFAQESKIYGGDFEPLWRAAQSFVTRGDDYLGYAYPPGGLLAFAPLGVVPFREGRFGWFLLAQPAVLALSMAGMLRLAQISGRSWRAVLLATATIWYFPVLHALVGMNFTLLVLPLYAWALLAVRRERWLLAALLIGASLALKPLLAPAVLPFLLARQFRAVIVVGLVPVVSSVLALALTPDPGGLIAAIRATFGQNEQVLTNTSVWGVAEFYGWPDGVTLAARGLVLVLCALTVLSLAYRHRTNYRSLTAHFELAAAGVLTQSLVFTFAWDFYLLLLLPGLYYTASHPTLLRHPLFQAGVALTYLGWYGADEPAPRVATYCVAMVLMQAALLWASSPWQPADRTSQRDRGRPTASRQP